MIHMSDKDPDRPNRQRIYLRALKTISNLEIIEGVFLRHKVSMKLAHEDGYALVIKNEEKGTDVNIASHLIHDAHHALFEKAVVIYNDSDLVTPIKIVTKEIGLPITIVSPFDRNSIQLKNVATDVKHIRKGLLRVSQFPMKLNDAVGEFSIPEKWIPKDQVKLKAIIFDFMGVLLFPRIDYRPDKIIDEIDSIIGKVMNDALFKQETLKKYALSSEAFDSILNKVADKYEAFKPLWRILPELRKKFKLAVINNGTSLTLPKFESKFHINETFDLFISSATEGVKKPDGNIYKLTVQRLGVKPDECLFMDDSLPNIEGAKKLGVATIHWENKQIGFERFLKFIDLA
jgi:epoxide hydrolase-like predicted phosphatase